MPQDDPVRAEGGFYGFDFQIRIEKRFQEQPEDFFDRRLDFYGSDRRRPADRRIQRAA
jgi:hypothetical protein